MRTTNPFLGGTYEIWQMDGSVAFGERGGARHPRSPRRVGDSVPPDGHPGADQLQSEAFHGSGALGVPAHRQHAAGSGGAGLHPTLHAASASIVINGVTVGTLYDRVLCPGSGSTCSSNTYVLADARAAQRESVERSQQAKASRSTTRPARC